MSEALLIFARNPEPGKVKTRLAATVGNDLAYSIYTKLLSHTVQVTQSLPFHKIVFYSGKVENDDIWNESYNKQLQVDGDLGDRMYHAFDVAFQNKYDKVVIIGTDLPELDEATISEAFIKLDIHDIVIGPAMDGGYYLIGMKKLIKPLFQGIRWSTDTVFNDTITEVEKLQLSYYSLKPLRDIDEEKDLPYFKQFLNEH